MATLSLYGRAALGILFSFLVEVYAHMGHGHSDGFDNMVQPTSFSDPNIVGNQEHMMQHMQAEHMPNRQMSESEMEFHYFRLHDTNNDTMLDGLELLKALSHMLPPMNFAPHEVNGKTAAEVENMKNSRIREMMHNYVQIIDNVLQMDDRDKDGYLTYPEYSLARRRDAVKMKEMQEKMLRNAHVAKEQMMTKTQQPYNSGL